MTKLLAQANQPLGSIQSLGEMDNFSRVGPGGAFFKFTSLISLLVGLMTIVAGLYFVFQILIGGLGWLSAGGDKGQVETARKRIQNAVLGLTIVVLSYALISVVGLILGFNILNPANSLGVPGA